MSRVDPSLPAAPPGLSLVLGAGGLLGSHVGRWLARSGARARFFDLSIDTIAPDIRAQPGIEVVQGNMLDNETLIRALHGVDRVFHLVGATVPSTSVDRVDIEIEANLLPTLRLLEAMRVAAVPLVIFPSSGGTVYGDDPGPAGAFSEDAPQRPSCSYGLGQILVEELLTFHAAHGGPSALIVRIANVYGPTGNDRRRQGAVNAFLQQVVRGEPLSVWGDGTAVRDFIYVDDLVGALAALVASGADGRIFNVGTGDGHSIAEVVALVGTVTGRAPRLERVPQAYAGVSRNVLDISRLQSRTGWRPQVDLATGIARTWQAMQDPHLGG